MPFTVSAITGDCLCTIALRRGIADCTTLRTVGANAAFLNAPLQAGDVITLPDPPLLHVQTLVSLLGGSAWIVQIPPVRWQASTVQFIRKAAAAPAAPAVINDIGVSRFVTQSVTENGNDNWANDTQRDYSATSSADPNTFSIAVHDPNLGGTTVPVVLEALKPIYNHARAIVRHERYAAGPLRAARSQVVTVEKLAALAAGDDFWSCELRLVVDETDYKLRPQQTLWIKDLFDEAAPDDVEILDHDVYARYEYDPCPRAAGTKCVLAEATIPLRRGDSVGLEIRIIRAIADCTTNDNGIVTKSAVQKRVTRNCRRVYAQEELTFTIDRLDTIDPPSDMLVVGEPNGPLASGARPAPSAHLVGQVAIQITVNLHDGTTAVHNIAAVAVPNGNTPIQTAGAIVTAINNTCGGAVTAVASVNPVEGVEPRGCVDVLLTAVGGRAFVTTLSAVADQDDAQIVTRTSFNVDDMDDLDQAADEMRRAAPPMRRLLFKSSVIHANRINIWVVKEDRGGLTTTALDYLLGAGLSTDAAVRNCLTMKKGAMDDDDIDYMYITLPHEIAHALADCDHVPGNHNNMSLLHPGQTVKEKFFDDKRISGPGSPNHPIMRVSNAGPAWTDAPAVGPSGASPLGVITINTTLHALIAANNSITKTAR